MTKQQRSKTIWPVTLAFVLLLASIQLPTSADGSGATEQIYLPAIQKAGDGPGGAPSATPSAMPTATPSATPNPTATSTPTASPTTTNSAPVEGTQTATATPTATPTATSTATATETAMATATTTTEPVPEIAASIGLTVSNAIQTDALGARLLAAEAVFAASQLAGTRQVVTNGTLTVDANNEATYDPNPADRLRAILADGRTFDFYVSQMQGNFSSNATNYLDDAHQFTVRMVAEPDNRVQAAAVELADIQITSTQGDGQLSIRVTGEMENAGQTYTVDLTAQGTYFFESSFGGLEQRSDYTLTGTVTGSVTGAQLALTVDERYRNERIVADGDSVSTADTENRNRWTISGASFAMIDGLIRRSFRNGNVSQLDSYWQATGELQQDGQPIGTFGLETLGIPTVRVVLRLGNRTIELQQFR